MSRSRARSPTDADDESGPVPHETTGSVRCRACDGRAIHIRTDDEDGGRCHHYRCRAPECGAGGTIVTDEDVLRRIGPAVTAGATGTNTRPATDTATKPATTPNAGEGGRQ